MLGHFTTTVTLTDKKTGIEVVNPVVSYIPTFSHQSNMVYYEFKFSCDTTTLAAGLYINPAIQQGESDDSLALSLTTTLDDFKGKAEQLLETILGSPVTYVE